MRTVVFIIIASVFTSTLFCQAQAAILAVPEIFDVNKVDGNEYEGSFFSSISEISLSPGEHILELEYSEVFDDVLHDDHTIIKSGAFLVKFVISNEQELILTRPAFDDEDSARIYARNPTVIISNADNTNINVASEKVPDEVELKISSVAITPTAIISTGKVTTSQQAIEKVTNIAETNVSLEKLAMLKYWWQQASAEEKTAFKQFINQTEK